MGQGRPSLDDLKKQALTAVDARQVFTQQMVDQVFSFAELGFQEHESSRYVTEVLEKNGFRPEGLAMRYLQIDGRWEDHLIHAITRDEWSPRTIGRGRSRS